MKWDTVLPVIVGGIIAICGSILTQGCASWLRFRRERRAVAHFIAGEIVGLLRIFKLRDYLARAEQMLRVIETNRQPAAFRLHVRQDYFVVFHGLAIRLGSLPPDLAERVSTFYTLLKSLIEDVSGDGAQAVTYSESMAVLSEQLNIFRELLNEGQELARDLRHV